ncbi:hypothetical protein BGZ63DRAFT_344924 [Mariannaea sp. PMI_226]|nr:hypothetical protein BGZ63DRAFT_344924 [Mariannaea sp. PMI_226]
MGKFSFPGRSKKQSPQVTVTVTAAPALTKAQKILGATALNIDSEFSASRISVASTNHPAAANLSSSYHGSTSKIQREWGDESEIVPRQFRTQVRPATSAAHEEDYDSFNEQDDFVSDMRSIMRRKQSSSTLSSWYDKSKQPLSISQQTSNSAMAKGLPPKVQKMLDIDPAAANSKAKKKPAKLDLSQVMSRKGKKQNQEQLWEGPILGEDQVVKSPSILSPVSSKTSLRGRLTRRPTKESLRSMKSEPNLTTDAELSLRVQNHLEGLPNLYEHYEKMSFHQVMNHNSQASGARERVLESMPPPMPSLEKIAASVSKSAQKSPVPPHHEEHVVSQYAKRTLPQTPQASFTKVEASSPTDCAASVSSRHTRTSKASKRTDLSFQESDLQEKSVLSLSSDSEDEMSMISAFKSPSSVPSYSVSGSSSLFDQRPQTSRTNQSADNKRSSKASRRTSVATSTKSTKSNNFLTIPNANIKPPTSSARSGSASGSSANTIQEGAVARSPSQMSSVSNTSSVNTASTWQSKSGHEPLQSHSKPVKPAQRTSDPEFEFDFDLGNNRKKQEVDDADDASDISPRQTYVPRDTALNSADQPTPPLSPTSVDFYIRSAHTSIDGHDSHNRFMAVTRQEEMLLAALRHKRQVMRENIISEIEDGARVDMRASNQIAVPKSHIAKPSEATITESNFEFDFPAPPMCKDKTTVSADGTTVIDLRDGSDQLQAPINGVDLDPKAKPVLSSSKKALLKVENEFSNNGQERILLYFDKPLGNNNDRVEEPEPSPNLSDFMEFETVEPESFRDSLSKTILSHSQSRQESQTRQRSQTRRESQARHDFAQMPQQVTALDVPRPDSPISPDPMSIMPRRTGTVDKKTARLSAVGPARWGYED